MKPLKKLSAKVAAAMLAAGMVLSSVSPVYASELTSVVQESQTNEVSTLSEIPLSDDQGTSETDSPAEPPAESTSPTTPPITEETPGQKPGSENTDQTSPANPDDQPSTDNPDSPEDNTPSEPTEDTPTPPTEDIPSEPTEDMPSEPAEGTPSEPAEDTPSKPAEDTPSEPAEGTPSEPAEDTPSEPTEDTPSEPTEDMLPESEDDKAADTDTEQPAEEEPSTDTSVLDTSWLNHIDYGKYFFNAVDMRKGFAQIDKVYAYAKVSDYLHVREKADEHSRIVGKLSANALCYVIADSDKEWVYIESGDVRGFVKSRYLQQGEEALRYVTQTGEENMAMAKLLIQPEDNKAFTYSTDTVYEVKHGTGEGVIRFADQFLGNPYVWGGNSLTEGIDCSHFVYQILTRCGVYDGGYTSSYGWRYVGEEVTSLSEAKAGDVVCYDGHVALYDGAGGIVEAKGRRWGITHDRRVDCSEILTIRRVISDEEEDGENAQIIRDYLMSNGFSKAGAAGIMANIANESYPAFEPSSLELRSIHKTGISSDQYTALVDSGEISKSEFIVSSSFGLYSGGRYGYGLCGFTDPKVKAYLYHYTVEQGKSVGSISGQLDSLLAYLSDNNPDLLSRLKNAEDPETAASAFLREYERCANMRMAEIKRTAAARSIYEAMD